MTRKITVTLNDHIKRLGVTQAQFAEMCGLRPATISQLITGKYERIQLTHLLAIMDTLGVTDFNEVLAFKDD